MKKSYPTGSEKKFNEFLVTEYLKTGSVDEVLKKYKFDLPISYAGYQRVLDKWGIIKAAGPNNTLGEAFNLLTKIAYDNIPFERVYKKMPSSFRMSAATLYRILSYVKEGVTRRNATGLIITPNGKKNKVLLAKDVSIPRMDLGKKHGSITIPMGFSRKRDPREYAVKRILQQEVFTNLVISKKFPKKVLNEFIKPFLYLDIADVRVEIYHLELSQNLSKINNFSSFKLKNYKYVFIKDVLNGKYKNLRVGVYEAIEGYNKYLNLKKRNLSINPLQGIAQVNAKIISLE